MLICPFPSGGPNLATRKRRAEPGGRKKGRPPSRDEAIGATSAGWAPKVLALLAFFGLLLFLYAPALDGCFISDDDHYVKRNVYIQDPTGDNLVAILDPTSVVGPLIHPRHHEKVCSYLDIAQPNKANREVALPFRIAWIGDSQSGMAPA